MAGDQARPWRRWFQFSLTSLFLLTTLVALWLAWELAFIRERQTWLRENAVLVDPAAATNQVTSAAGSATVSFVQIIPPPLAVMPTIPWWRRLLGDEAVPTISEGDNWTEDDRALVARLFPEANIFTPPGGSLFFTVSGDLNLLAEPPGGLTTLSIQPDSTQDSQTPSVQSPPGDR